MAETKVLVVDDEYFNFEMLEVALQHRFSLHYADSGKAALAQSIALKPDVIILDVCMPGLDGYDTCRLIKNTPETQCIPVLMLTGLETPEEKDEAYRAGCDDYLTKPFEMSELVEKLDNISTIKVVE
jgi:putative two-component system response regulator